MLLCSMIAYFVNVEAQGVSTLWDKLMEQDNIDPTSLKEFIEAALAAPVLCQCDSVPKAITRKGPYRHMTCLYVGFDTQNSNQFALNVQLVGSER